MLRELDPVPSNEDFAKLCFGALLVVAVVSVHGEVSFLSIDRDIHERIHQYKK